VKTSHSLKVYENRVLRRVEPKREEFKVKGRLGKIS
jgi:hypothetical protein